MSTEKTSRDRPTIRESADESSRYGLQSRYDAAERAERHRSQRRRQSCYYQYEQRAHQQRNTNRPTRPNNNGPSPVTDHHDEWKRRQASRQLQRQRPRQPTFSGRGRGGNSNKPKKKQLADYVYYLGSVRQAADYETTTQYLVNHIKATFDYGIDIATALDDLQPFDASVHKPKLSVSRSTNDETKAAANRQFEIEFKAELDVYMKRKQAYENNLTKAYAFLWEHCTKSMQSKIEARTDFAKLKDDPIELLKAIKQHALNYQEHRYEMSIILDALRSVINLKQREGEILHDYTKRFKTARDVMISHIGGPLILTKYVPTMKDYDANDANKIKKCQEEAFDQLMAFIYLENSDNSKYGSLLTGLRTQQSLGNNQYPLTFTDATNVLTNHRFDKSPSKSSVQKDKDKNPSQKKDEEEAPELSFAQMEGKCYCCGKGGHMSPKCPQKDSKPREQWAINKLKPAEQSHAQAQQQQQQQQAAPAAGTNQHRQPKHRRIRRWSSSKFIDFSARMVRSPSPILSSKQYARLDSAR